MLIKSADDRRDDVQALQGLLQRPGITPLQAERIDREIRKIRAGAKAEAEAAYDIDFHHKDSKNWALIHDLRIEFQGRVAQIDHLLINRCLDFWVCESKSFSQGVSMNDAGEFTSFYAGRPQGIPSPVEQNRRHIAVLQAVLASSLVSLPTRLGITLGPRFHSLVLISQGARITRPAKPFEGMETVIKSDNLRSAITSRIDKASGLDTLLSATRFVGSDTLHDLALQIVRLHRPLRVQWAAKFGMAEAVDEAAVPAVQEPQARYASVGPLPAPAPDLRPQSLAPAASAAAPEPAVPVMARAAADASAGVVAQLQTAPPVDGVERLPTSRLGARWGLRNAAETLACLEAGGYLTPLPTGGHQLTEKAQACGAVFVEKSRHGPYFLWPADLPRA